MAVGGPEPARPVHPTPHLLRAKGATTMQEMLLFFILRIGHGDLRKYYQIIRMLDLLYYSLYEMSY